MRTTIRLTDARPVSVEDAEWPIVLQKNHHRGQFSVFLRRHQDGRRLLYGTASGDVHGGYLLEYIGCHEADQDTQLVNFAHKLADDLGRGDVVGAIMSAMEPREL